MLGSEVGKRLVKVKVNVNLGGESRVARNEQPATVALLTQSRLSRLWAGGE